MRLLRPYNPLVYPGGRLPGFDPAHPASANAAFAGAAIGSGFAQMFPTFQCVGPTSGSMAVTGIGPAVLFNSAVGDLSFSGNSSVLGNAATLAAIIMRPTATGTHFLVFNSNNGAGSALLWASNNHLQGWFHNDAANADCGFTLLAGIPYFVALSFDGVSVANWIAARLDTGAIQTATTSFTPGTGALNGTVSVGNWGGHNSAVGGYTAAAMWAKSFMGIPSLRAWAADPWAFWYPPTREMAIFSGLHAPAGGGSTTLTAATGTFTETGVAATFQIQDPEAVGAFAETGIAATTQVNLVASAGAFTETGQAVTFLQATLLVAAAGSFTETGIAALFEQFLASAAGSFIETGFAAQLGAPALVMLVGSGAFVLTGFPAIELLSSGWRVWYGPGTQWSSTTKPNSNWTLEPPRVPWSQG